jgi:hypothetical protein
MAEIINSNVFDSTKKFVDFAGLDYFWGKAKAYVDAADKVIADKVAALETTVGDANSGLVKGLDDLKATVEALGGAEGGIQGMIDSSIAALDVEDTAVEGKYVSAVEEVDGKIKVTRADLPDYSNTYADKAATEAHIVDTDIHITAQERTDWNAAKSAIDTFLKDAELDAEGVNVIDTLKELQTYVGSDPATALVTRVGNLETAVETINGDGEGSIAKAKADALAAVSTLENGAVKTNTDAIAVINGDGEGSIAKAKADALAAVSTLENGAVKTNTDAIAVINGDGEGSIAKAKEDAIAAAVAQAQVDAAKALEDYYTKTEVNTLLETNSATDQAYAAAYTDALYTSITFAQEADIDTLFNVSAE